jgi:hypothetical protein
MRTQQFKAHFNIIDNNNLSLVKMSGVIEAYTYDLAFEELAKFVKRANTYGNYGSTVEIHDADALFQKNYVPIKESVRVSLAIRTDDEFIDAYLKNVDILEETPDYGDQVGNSDYGLMNESEHDDDDAYVSEFDPE